MPKYREWVCDLCGKSETVEHTADDPVGWIEEIGVFCPNCWASLKSVAYPAIEDMKKKLGTFLDETESPEARIRVTALMLCSVLGDIRRHSVDKEPCNAE